MKFAVNWDYRCPFARNAHEHIAVGLADGADWEVTFLPFSLSQVHVAEGDPPVWDNPDKANDLMALASGVVVRDQYPDRFLDAHFALFTARHDDGRDLRLPEVVADILDGVGLPGDKVIAEVQSGAPLQEIGKVHQQSVSEWRAFGVPTFVVDGRAAFVRIMSRPEGDAVLARRNIDGVLQLFDSLPDLNEYKFTTLER
jgi:hypothetical protein